MNVEKIKKLVEKNTTIKIKVGTDGTDTWPKIYVTGILYDSVDFTKYIGVKFEYEPQETQDNNKWLSETVTFKMYPTDSEERVADAITAIYNLGITTVCK